MMTSPYLCLLRAGLSLQMFAIPKAYLSGWSKQASFTEKLGMWCFNLPFVQCSGGGSLSINVSPVVTTPQDPGIQTCLATRPRRSRGFPQVALTKTGTPNVCVTALLQEILVLWSMAEGEGRRRIWHPLGNKKKHGACWLQQDRERAQNGACPLEGKRWHLLRKTKEKELIIKKKSPTSFSKVERECQKSTH